MPQYSGDSTHLIRDLKGSYEELRQMQEVLVKFERVSAINQTVVTLNDKINNPLTVIQGHTELLKVRFSNKEPAALDSLDVIEESVRQCAKILTKLKNINEPAVKSNVRSDTTMIDIENSTFNDDIAT